MRFRHIVISLMIGVFAPLAVADAADGNTSPAEPQKTTPSEGSVARAVFTSGVKDREPVDKLTSLTTDSHQVYFFTDLRNLNGHMIRHRWEYNGKTMATVEFGVGGPRWRVWSSKSLLPQWTGKWTVSVVDEKGKVLDQASFAYTQAAK